MADLMRTSSMPLSNDFWRAVCVLAYARMGINDNFRVINRDRGGALNFENDIQGVVGELVSIHKAVNDPLCENTTHE